MLLMPTRYVAIPQNYSAVTPHVNVNVNLYSASSQKTPLMHDVGYLSSTFERYIAFHF